MTTKIHNYKLPATHTNSEKNNNKNKNKNKNKYSNVKLSNNTETNYTLRENNQVASRVVCLESRVNGQSILLLE